MIPTEHIVRGLSTLQPLCPDMRFGQMLATLGLLGEDMHDKTLWDIEDEQFIEVIDRFRHDLAHRQQGVA